MPLISLFDDDFTDGGQPSSLDLQFSVKIELCFEFVLKYFACRILWWAVLGEVRIARSSYNESYQSNTVRSFELGRCFDVDFCEFSSNLSFAYLKYTLTFRSRIALTLRWSILLKVVWLSNVTLFSVTGVKIYFSTPHFLRQVSTNDSSANALNPYKGSTAESTSKDFSFNFKVFCLLTFFFSRVGSFCTAYFT